MKTTCPNCSTIFEDGSMFCNKCGSKLEVEVPIETAPYLPENTAPLEAYTPQHTPNETKTTKQPEAVAPTATKEKKVKKVKKKTGLIAGIIGGIIGIPLILIIVLIIALSSSDDNNTEETTASTPTTQATQSTSQLSEDIFEFTIKLNGVVYKFPETVDNFESNGWVIADDKKSATLESQESIDVSAKNDTGYITLHFFNDGDTAKSVKDCQVGGITLSFNRSNTYTIELSKGLVLTEESTLTDIIFLWGEYNYIERLQYFYEEARTISNSCAYIFETDTDGKLLSVVIKNYDTDNIYSNGTTIAGVSIDNASPVDALSSNLADGVVSFDGIPQALPTKVGDVISSGGWQLVIGPTKVAPHEFTTIVLTKNIRKFGFDNLVTLHIINTTDAEISYEDATIIGISYDSAYESTYPILEFANGITLGMPEAEFLSATNNYEFTVETSGETIYYKTPVTEDGFEYTFSFRENKTLESMDIMYQYAVTDYDALFESF